MCGRGNDPYGAGRGVDRQRRGASSADDGIGRVGSVRRMDREQRGEGETRSEHPAQAAVQARHDRALTVWTSVPLAKVSGVAGGGSEAWIAAPCRAVKCIERHGGGEGLLERALFGHDGRIGLTATAIWGMLPTGFVHQENKA